MNIHDADAYDENAAAADDNDDDKMFYWSHCHTGYYQRNNGRSFDGLYIQRLWGLCTHYANRENCDNCFLSEHFMKWSHV